MRAHLIVSLLFVFALGHLGYSASSGKYDRIGRDLLSRVNHLSKLSPAIVSQKPQKLPELKEPPSRPKMSCYVCNTGPGNDQNKCRLGITDQALSKTVISGYNVTLDRLLRKSHSSSSSNFTQEFFLTPKECNEGEMYCTTLASFKVGNITGNKPDYQHFETDR